MTSHHRRLCQFVTDRDDLQKLQVFAELVDAVRSGRLEAKRERGRGRRERR